tara:strand:+ start:348 stop:1280 length:933 start_codon:yes stop_codon:yes gene_type:complete
MRDEGRNPVVLDAGDLFFSTPEINETNRLSEQFRADAILKGYEKIGCDAINVGRYELSAGLDFLIESERKSTIPFISANLRYTDNNKLVFKPYHIVKRQGLTIGVIGLTSFVSDTTLSIAVDDYLVSGRRVIDQIRSQVDVLVMLVNSARESYKKLPNEFSKADLIYTSGSTMMTRPMMKQSEEGPYLYSCGREGRYLNVTDLNIADKEKPLTNISYLQENMKYIKRKLDRLGDADPERPLDELYSDQDGVLNVIAQSQAVLESSGIAIENAVNMLYFKNEAMDETIKDDKEMVKFVEKSISVYNDLIKK